MAGNWDFGGAYADTSGSLQRQDMLARAEPATLANLEATARFNKTRADAAEFEFAAEQQTQKLMQQMSLTGLEEGSARISKLAEIYARGGNPTAAGNMLTKAAQARAQEAASEAAKARQAQAEAERNIKLGGRLSQLMNGVETPEDFNRATMIFMSESGEPLPDELRQYSPETVRVLRESGIKLADRERLALMADDLARKEADSRALRVLRGAQTTAANALTSLRNSKTNADEKDGGKGVVDPPKPLRDAAYDMLDADGLLEDLEGADAEIAAYDLASYAQQLRQQNKNLDPSQALQRAFAEEKTRGAYVKGNPGIPFVPKALDPTFTKGKFVSRGAGGQPPAMTSAADVAKLPTGAKFSIDGQMYENLGGGKARKLPGRSGAVK